MVVDLQPEAPEEINDVVVEKCPLARLHPHLFVVLEVGEDLLTVDLAAKTIALWEVLQWLV
jgi:hypothetical protein